MLANGLQLSDFTVKEKARIVGLIVRVIGRAATYRGPGEPDISDLLTDASGIERDALRRKNSK